MLRTAKKKFHAVVGLVLGTRHADPGRGENFCWNPAIPEKNKPRGFSFSEVVFAILLIGAALVPIFHIFSRSAAGTIQTQDEVLAHNYAEELLDFVMTQPNDYPLLVPTPAPVQVDPARLILKTTGGDLPLVTNPKFVRFLSVREPENPMKWPYKYKLLVAEVQWTSPSRVPRKVRMSAYKLL